MGKTRTSDNINWLWQAQWGGALADSTTRTDMSEKSKYEGWELYQKQSTKAALKQSTSKNIHFEFKY